MINGRSSFFSLVSRWCVPFLEIFGNLHKTKSQLRQTVLYQPLFFRCQISSCLFLQHPQQIDRMAGQRKVGFGFFILLSKMHQSQMHLRLHQNRFHQKNKARRRKREVGRVFSILSHNYITMLLIEPLLKR